MKFSPLRLAVPWLLIPAVLACASGADRPPPGLARVWKQYLSLPEARALAIAGDPHNVWVSGAAGGQASSAEAEQAALQECLKRRGLRRMQSPCRLYAVGSEIVWRGW